MRELEIKVLVDGKEITTCKICSENYIAPWLAPMLVSGMMNKFDFGIIKAWAFDAEAADQQNLGNKK
jgi:hypothetical protein